MRIIETIAGWFRRDVAVSTELLEAIEAGAHGVSGENALRCIPVVAAVRLLAETVAQLPLKVYVRTADGREESPEHPVYELLKSAPNPTWTSFEWRERMMLDVLIHGNHYSQLLLNGKAEVREIVPLPSRSVTPRRDGARLDYEYQRAEGGLRRLDQREVLHVMLMRNHRDTGTSLVDLAARTIGLTMSAEEFAARFFEQGAAPRLIYKAPQSMRPDQIKEFRREFNLAYAGARNAHQMFVLSGAGELQVLQHDVEKLQLSATRENQVAEVARLFGVPPHLIGDLRRSTFSNVEHENIRYVVHTADPHLKRIEQRLNMSLFGPREQGRPYCEFDVDGLLRGDYRSRVEGMAREINTAMLTPNEARAKQNRRPEPGGDLLYIQGATVPLGDAGAKKKGAA